MVTDPNNPYHQPLGVIASGELERRIGFVPHSCMKIHKDTFEPDRAGQRGDTYYYFGPEGQSAKVVSVPSVELDRNENDPGVLPLLGSLNGKPAGFVIAPMAPGDFELALHSVASLEAAFAHPAPGEQAA
jgi:hypothetical protein